MTLLKNKFEFFWQKQIQPSELDRMSYWEFEEYIKMMNDRNKEENDKNKKQQDDQQAQQSKYMPKMPNMNMGNFSPSKYKPPKF